MDSLLSLFFLCLIKISVFLPLRPYFVLSPSWQPSPTPLLRPFPVLLVLLRGDFLRKLHFMKSGLLDQHLIWSRFFPIKAALFFCNVSTYVSCRHPLGCTYFVLLPSLPGSMLLAKFSLNGNQGWMLFCLSFCQMDFHNKSCLKKCFQKLSCVLKKSYQTNTNLQSRGKGLVDSDNQFYSGTFSSIKIHPTELTHFAEYIIQVTFDQYGPYTDVTGNKII